MVEHNAHGLIIMHLHLDTMQGQSSINGDSRTSLGPFQDEAQLVAKKYSSF